MNIGGTNVPEAGSSVSDRDIQVALSLSSVLSESLYSETRLLVSHSRQDQRANSDKVGESYPSSTRGGSPLQAQLRDELQFQILENLTLAVGAHTFKAGIDFRRVAVDASVRFNPLGTFIFQNDVQVAPDDPSTYPLLYQLIRGEPDVEIDNATVGLFLQDHWEISERFSLNFGLRYDFESYRFPSELAVDTVVPNGRPKRDGNNIAPRFSLSWRPFPQRPFVLKGGAGLFYDQIALAFPSFSTVTSGQEFLLAFLPPFGPEFVQANGPAAVAEFLTEVGSLRFGVRDGLQTPFSHQYTLGFEWEPMQRSLMSVYYVHAEGENLLRLEDVNSPIGFGSEGPIRPDPTYGPVALLSSTGSSIYDALEIYLQRQGPLFSGTLAYTLSRSQNDVTDPLSGDGLYLPSDSGNLASEWGRASNDQRHRLVTSGSVRWPPWGISLSGIMQYGSGLPFNVTSGLDQNADGQMTDRPPGIPRNTGAQTSLALVNAYRQGLGLPATQTKLREPGFFTLDLKVSKQMTFGAVSAEIFGQVFNVTNYENLGLVESSVLSPFFGRPTALVSPPRRAELGVRLRWSGS